MRGLLRIGCSLALRHLPRLGAPGGSRGSVPVPGFCGRPAGGGPGAGVASGAFAVCLETSFPCRWLSALVCRQAAVPARGGVKSPRPAGRVQRRDCSRRPKAPSAAFSRTALRALPSALVGVQPTTVPGVPSRDAGKAAASSRCALPPRRAGVVSTSEAGTDDAGNPTSWLAGRHVLRANGQLTRHFGAVRKVATRLPRVMQAKRLTQPRNGAQQGRRGCSHAGNRVSHAAHSNTCKRLRKFPGARQVRAIYTYLTEVPETHA